MQALQFQHERIRTLATRELFKFGIKLKIKKLPSKKFAPGHRCFAVCLNNMETVDVKLDNDTIPVPKIFTDLTTFIRKDLNEEGIFRKEGSKVKEKMLVKKLDEGNPIPENTTSIEACAVLKIFLRNIPGRLIPSEFMPWFLEAGSLEKNSAEAVGLCILLLPLRNIYLLVFLMQFFHDVTTQSPKNKMDAYNMAAVIAPNIFPSVQKADLQAQSEMSNLMIKITKIMIERAITYESVPDAILNKIEDLRSEELNKKSICACIK